MKTRFFFSAIVIIGASIAFFPYDTKAQVTIGSNTPPNAASVLDIISTTRGVSFPQLNLATTTTQPAGLPKDGTIVYNTNAGITGTTANGVGLYVWIATQWVSLNTNNPAASASWLLNGNNNNALRTFGTNDNFDLAFETNNTERMRLTTTTGFLGMGTTAPTTAIQLVNDNVSDQKDDIRITTYSSTFTPAILMDRFRGTPAAPANLVSGDDLGSIQSFGRVNNTVTGLTSIYSEYIGDGTTARCNIVFSTSTTGNVNNPRLTLDENGALYPAGDNVAAQTLGRSGNRWSAVWAGNGTIQTSDIRRKENITPLQYGLNDILKLDPISYSWKDDKTHKTKLGLSAQQLQSVLPEVVVEGTDEDKILGVYYSDIIPVLINAIKEQQVQIEDLKTKVKALETGAKK